MPKYAIPLAALALLLLCGLGIAFLVLSTRTTDIVGVVQSVQWERTIAVLEQRPVDKEGWSDEIPAGAQKGACRPRVRRTVNEPVPGAQKVCGTPYTVDQGSGVGKVVQDCQYQVSESWCSYKVNEWTVVESKQANGNDLNPQWPSLSLNMSQREGERQEKYQVQFDADGKKFSYTTQNATEFPRYKPGTQWTLKVNTFGAVTSVEAAR